MRTFLCLAIAGAAFGATNTINSDADWYGDGSNWSLGRFPRNNDDVVVNADVIIGGVAKPSTYDGATEGEDIEITGSIEITGGTTVLELGLQANAPENCVVGNFGDWMYDEVVGECSKTCDTGTQSRSRTNTEPRYGGDACPDPSTNVENNPCNVQACTCASGKDHGETYAGVGANYCNMCKCHNGADVCDNRNCNVQSGSQVCEATTCAYGALFHDNDEFVSFDEAVAQRGADWQNTEDFELSTLVKHHKTDANGKIFHCGHKRDTVDTCQCFCSDGSNSEQHHIWHHAQRHADSIAAGKTSAGCTCAVGWTTDGVPTSGKADFAAGQTFTGCQNPAVAGEPAGYGGKLHSSWCKIVAGSCPSNSRTVPAGGLTGDWDTCEAHATFKITMAEPISAPEP